MQTETYARQVQHLRRYVRALVGPEAGADTYVSATLEALLAGDPAPPGELGPRLGLYCTFHRLWRPDTARQAVDSPAQTPVDERLQALPPIPRAALLLTTMEDFSVAEAGVILGRHAAEVEAMVHQAQEELKRQMTTDVLIIEDNSVIAIDLKRLVRQLGHNVVGVAATQQQAVSMARDAKPGLVLADIRLADGSSGVNAIHEIRLEQRPAVVFITAFPNRLFSAQRAQPSYLVTKPFVPETVRDTIEQALFFHDSQ